jgi:RNA polymerase sigma factor (sigma-70 family)
MDIEGFVSSYEYIIERMIRIFKVKNNDFIDDIKQELRMKLVHVYDQVIHKDSIENLESYIFIILKRTTINILKKESRFKHISLNQKRVNSNEEWINEIIDLKTLDDSSGKLDEMIKYMDDYFTVEEKELFHLYFESNFSYEEIGKMYQTSRETIRRKLNQMKEKIRRWYT